MQEAGIITGTTEISGLRERREEEAAGLSGVISDPRGLGHEVVKRAASTTDGRQIRPIHLRLLKMLVMMMMMMMMMMVTVMMMMVMMMMRLMMVMGMVRMMRG